MIVFSYTSDLAIFSNVLLHGRCNVQVNTTGLDSAFLEILSYVLYFPFLFLLYFYLWMLFGVFGSALGPFKSIVNIYVFKYFCYF